MSQDYVLASYSGGIATLTMNRPDRHNAIDTSMTAALRDALARAEADPAVRVIVLTGAGRSFCAGMDLAAFLEGKGDEILFGENRFAGFVDAPYTKPLIARRDNQKHKRLDRG